MKKVSATSIRQKILNKQWKAFRKRMSMVSMPEDFTDIVGGVREFLKPTAQSIIKGEIFAQKWTAAGNWSGISLS